MDATNLPIPCRIFISGLGVSPKNEFFSSPSSNLAYNIMQWNHNRLAAEQHRCRYYCNGLACRSKRKVAYHSVRKFLPVPVNDWYAILTITVYSKITKILIVRCIFWGQILPKSWPGLRLGPRWGSLRRSPRPLVSWGGGHPLGRGPIRLNYH